MTTGISPDARQALRDAADAHADTAQSLRNMAMLLEASISSADAAIQTMRTASASMEALRSAVDSAVNLNLRASAALARAVDALDPDSGNC